MKNEQKNSIKSDQETYAEMLDEYNKNIRKVVMRLNKRNADAISQSKVLILTN